MMETAAPTAAPAKRPNALRRLYNWTLSWAETPYGTPALAGLSFAESSFFPIPPDVLLAALCFGSPRKWWWYATVCSIASVLGGVLGWAIGLFFWEVSQDFFFSYIPGFTQENFDLVAAKYEEGAFLAILGAAFTPIPYKVFTILSGVTSIHLGTLVLASVIGRSGRFFLVAALIRYGGVRMKPFLEKYFELFALLLFVLMVLGFLAIKWLL